MAVGAASALIFGVVSRTNCICVTANQKQFAKQYRLALRKVIDMTKNAPTDLRLRSPLPVSAPQLGIDKEWFDHGHLLRHLKLLHAICESWENSKLGKPKPSAYEKRLAAEAALHLLRAPSGKIESGIPMMERI
jgi:hypothetical protein